jgi:hypothetical protein
MFGREQHVVVQLVETLPVPSVPIIHNDAVAGRLLVVAPGRTLWRVFVGAVPFPFAGISAKQIHCPSGLQVGLIRALLGSLAISVGLDA